MVPAPQVDPSGKGITGSDSTADRRQKHTIPTESIAQVKTDGVQRTTRTRNWRRRAEFAGFLHYTLSGREEYVDGGAETANRRVAWTPKSNEIGGAGVHADAAAALAEIATAREEAVVRETLNLIPPVTPVAGDDRRRREIQQGDSVSDNLGKEEVSFSPCVTSLLFRFFISSHTDTPAYMCTAHTLPSGPFTKPHSLQLTANVTTLLHG